MIPLESPSSDLAGPGGGNLRSRLSDQLLVPGAAGWVLLASIAVGLGLLAALLYRPAFGGPNVLLLLPPGDWGKVDDADRPGELRGEQTQRVSLNVDGDAVVAVARVIGVDVAENVGGGPALVVDAMSGEDPAEMPDVLPTQPGHAVDQGGGESLNRQTRPADVFVAAPFPGRARQRGAW